MSDLSDWLSDSRSFVRSNLSESLTVAHLIWAILANERMSDEWMIEFPALLILDDARCLAPWSKKATIYNVYIQFEYEGSVVFTQQKESSGGIYNLFHTKYLEDNNDNVQCTRAITLRSSAMSVTLHSYCLLCSRIGFSFLLVSLL